MPPRRIIVAEVLDLFRLNGRVALVTGGGTGLGRGMALALASAGADVAVAGRRASPLEATAEAIRRLGRRGLALVADVANPEARGSMVAHCEAALGPLDILVNSAGMIRRAAALDVSLTEWDVLLRTNLTSAFHLSQLAARSMLVRGYGKIINVASVLSFQGGVRAASYTASKSAIAGVTRALANEWAGRGINVNAIAPGYMETDLTQPILDDRPRYQAILDRIPAGRWGTPDDLAGAVVFLASEASRYVHGVVLVVDGGWLSR